MKNPLEELCSFCVLTLNVKDHHTTSHTTITSLDKLILFIKVPTLTLGEEQASVMLEITAVVNNVMLTNISVVSQWEVR